MKWSTFFGVVCALVILAAMLNAGVPAQAAEVKTADFNCDTVAQANGIEVYYCVPDEGPAFFMNGYGFMTVPVE